MSVPAICCKTWALKMAREFRPPFESGRGRDMLDGVKIAALGVLTLLFAMPANVGIRPINRTRCC